MLRTPCPGCVDRSRVQQTRVPLQDFTTALGRQAELKDALPLVQALEQELARLTALAAAFGWADRL